MFIELGTLVLSTMLSLAGVGLAPLNVAAASSPALSCATQTADNCLQSEACDLFVAAGTDVCGVACEMRSVDSCAMDANCAIVDGVCDYADYSPVGC